MKRYAYVLVITFVAFGCSPVHDDDSSPGVDEYFRMEVGGVPWQIEDDEVLSGILDDGGPNDAYTFLGNSPVDSSVFYYVIPYFHANDTTFSLDNVSPVFALDFQADLMYKGFTSGTFHIIRSEVNNKEVFTGTFDYIGLELVTDAPTHFSNGEFVIARDL